MNVTTNDFERMLAAEYKRHSLTWSDITRFIRIYIWVILLVFVTTVVCTYAGLALYSDKYDTIAKLLVKVGRETVDPPATTAARGGTLISSGVRREDVASEVQILTSQDIAE